MSSSHLPRARFARLMSVLLAVAVALVACSDDAEESATPDVVIAPSPEPEAIPEDTTSLAGAVLDWTTGAPIEGAQVFTSPDLGALETTGEGAFIFAEGVQDGALYRLLVQARGYSDGEAVVLARGGQRVRVDVLLVPEASRPALAMEPGAVYLPSDQHSRLVRLVNRAEASQTWSLEGPEWLRFEPAAGQLGPGQATPIRAALDPERFAATAPEVTTLEDRAFLRDGAGGVQVIDVRALRGVAQTGALGWVEPPPEPWVVDPGAAVELVAQVTLGGQPLQGAALAIQVSDGITRTAYTGVNGRVPVPLRAARPGFVDVRVTLPAYPSIAPLTARLEVAGPPDTDRDDDGVLDADDNCPDTSNPDQLDSDSDDLGDVCDPDRDGDSVDNADDNCPDTPNTDQLDSDANGLGDACDPNDACDPDIVADTRDTGRALAFGDEPITALCQDDEDWFTVPPADDGCTLTLALRWDTPPAPDVALNVDVFVDGEVRSGLAFGLEGATPDTSAELPPASVGYDLRATLVGRPLGRFATYAVKVEQTCVDTCGDLLEPNDDALSAIPLDPIADNPDFTFRAEGTVCGQDDEDWFVMAVDQGCTAEVLLLWDDLNGTPTPSFFDAERNPISVETTTEPAGQLTMLTAEVPVDVEGGLYARMSLDASDTEPWYIFTVNPVCPPECPLDTYEPNDTPELPIGPISAGELPLPAGLCPDGSDVDHYVFAAGVAPYCEAQVSVNYDIGQGSLAVAIVREDGTPWDNVMTTITGAGASTVQRATFDPSMLNDPNDARAPAIVRVSGTVPEYTLNVENRCVDTCAPDPYEGDDAPLGGYFHDFGASGDLDLTRWMCPRDAEDWFFLFGDPNCIQEVTFVQDTLDAGMTVETVYDGGFPQPEESFGGLGSEPFMRAVEFGDQGTVYLRLSASGAEGHAPYRITSTQLCPDCVGNVNEPNGDPASPFALTGEQTQDVLCGAGGDEDWYVRNTTVDGEWAWCQGEVKVTTNDPYERDFSLLIGTSPPGHIGTLSTGQAEQTFYRTGSPDLGSGMVAFGVTATRDHFDTYDLTNTFDCGAVPKCPDNDIAEPNESSTEAYPLYDLATLQGDRWDQTRYGQTFALCGAADQDWFEFDLGPSCALELELYFDTSRHTIDTRFYLDGQDVPDAPQPETITNGQRFFYAPQQAGRYHVALTNVQGVDEAVYALRHRVSCIGQDLPQCGQIDPYEPNDVSTQAARVYSGDAVTSALCVANSVDWYRVQLGAGCELNALLTQTHDSPGVMLEVYDNPDNAPTMRLAAETPHALYRCANAETCAQPRQVVSPSPVRRDRWLRVAFDPFADPVDTEYTLDVGVECASAPPLSCPQDDLLEPNDGINNATPHTLGALREAIACPGNADWYSVDVPTECALTARVELIDATTPLSLRVVNANQAEVGTLTADPVSGDVHTEAFFLAGGPHSVEVVGDEATRYDLRLGVICPSSGP